MSISNILMLVGGLALFLYGMHMMSEGLEVAAGNRMKSILEKLTSNRFVGVAVGAIITAIIQSSSATTVMVVGFVNSSLLQLEQAVWLIMGANIGTTITGQLIALDISKIAPLFAIIGVVMVSFIKKKKVNYIGEIIAGLGILFIGMGMMSNAMIPLRDYQPFINLIANFSNPIIGILVGALFTAIIQSSSASVGILQALVLAGVLPFSSAIYVLFGQNIGTCITAVLASIGANRNAKRTTIIHLSFNIIGTVIFLIVVSFLPFTDWMMSITSNPAAQIANTHTVFNVVTTLALLPFGAYLAKLAKIILPLKPEESEDEDNFSMSYINENNIGTVAIALSTLRNEVALMMSIARKNVIRSFDVIIKGNEEKMTKIVDSENRIDMMNYEISKYMARASSLDMNTHDAMLCNSLFKLSSDIERIGDHALNIGQYGGNNDHKLNLNSDALIELKELQTLLADCMNIIDDKEFTKNPEIMERVRGYEEESDILTYKFRQRQISRLMNKECSADHCVIYSEILTDIERIFDHLLNITQECYRAGFTLENA
ncbi:MAG: Na/Pi cotransporter family protein [Erysipelotrichaceae bacterium]